MSNLDHPRPYSSAPHGRDRRAARNGRSGNSFLSPELISEAVVAGYLHDISARHSQDSALRRNRRERGEQHLAERRSAPIWGQDPI